MSTQSFHATAWILAFTGGLVIVVGGVIEVFLLAFGPYGGTFYGMGPGMMSGYGFYNFGQGIMTALCLLALVFGVLVLFSSIMLRNRPADHILWGILILVFAIASFIGMGGYFIGAVLAVAGAALALSYRTSNTAK